MFVSLLLLAAPLLGAPAQEPAAAEPTSDELPDGVIAVWKGGRIIDEVFERWLGGTQVFPEFRDEALRHLIQLHFIRHAALLNNIEVSDEEAEKRVQMAEVALAENEQNLEAVLAERVMTRDEFRDLMRSSLLHEKLTRATFGLAEDRPVTPQEINAWTAQFLPEATLAALVEEAKNAPVGMALQNGDLNIGVQELGLTLRRTVPAARLRGYVEQLAVQDAMPRWAASESLVLSDDFLQKEVNWRRAFVARSPESFGATYEMILETRGLTLEDVMKSDELRSAGYLWLYAEHRFPDSWFDSLSEVQRSELGEGYGTSRRTAWLLLRAMEKPEELDLSFEDATAELQRMATEVSDEESFLSLAEKYSDDEMSRRRRGMLGWLHIDEPRSDPALCRAAFDTALGTVSQPIRVKGGMALVFPVEEQAGPKDDAFRDAVRRGKHLALRAEFLAGIELRTVYDR